VKGRFSPSLLGLCSGSVVCPVGSAPAGASSIIAFNTYGVIAKANVGVSAPRGFKPGDRLVFRLYRRHIPLPA
jgi:hypothetical protein